MVHRRDEPPRTHHRQQPFELLPHGVLSQMHDHLVESAQHLPIGVLPADSLHIDSRLVLQRKDALNAAASSQGIMESTCPSESMRMETP